jgi:hypothetical protein
MNHNAATLDKYLGPQKAVQQEGARICMLGSAFSTMLDVSLFGLSMLLYNLTTDLNQ